MRKIILLTTALLVLAFGLSGDSFRFSVDINPEQIWKDEAGISWVSESFSIPASYEVETISWTVEKSKPIKFSGNRPEKQIQFWQGKARNQRIVTIKIFPYIRRSDGWHIIEQITLNVKVRPTQNNRSEERATLRTAGTSSIFAKGTWHKWFVTKPGVYKLTYEDLASAGFTGMTPSNIRVYSTYGKPLPERAGAPRVNEPVEIPVYVSDGGDGSFDPGDFILFYVEGPSGWDYDFAESKWKHWIHYYDTVNYVYVTISNEGIPRRVNVVPQTSSPPTINPVTTGEYLVFHEKELYNPLRTGRRWFGEDFEYQTSRNFSFTLPSQAVGQALITTQVLSLSYYGNTAFSVSGNGSFLHSHTISPVSNATPYHPRGRISTKSSFLNANGTSTININLTYQKAHYSDKGWLDWIEIVVPVKLQYAGKPLHIVNSSLVGEVPRFVVSNVPSGAMLWEVTDPLNYQAINYDRNGNDIAFTVNMDTIRQFVVFHPSDVGSPQYAGQVDNQDLHGATVPDMLIITLEEWREEARQLAQWHRDKGLSVLVVSLEEVFNEFSGGKQDPTAIRDFAKYLYDQDPAKFKYLLLFGDASYDYKGIIHPVKHIPAYESVNSLDPLVSYLTDDYYAFLDDNEGADLGDNSNQLDIAVGRLPVNSKQEATVLIDKIKAYEKSFGNWRYVVTFVADDEDNNLHIRDADAQAEYLSRKHRNYLVDKIYLDAYPQQLAVGGQRYPDVNKAIIDRINTGTLIWSYTGHGNELGLAHERIFMEADISKLFNYPNFAFFVTATCEFSRFDDPGIVSAGEQTLLKPDGGTIGLLTTVRLVYSSANFDLSFSFFKRVFNWSGMPPTIGEIARRSKNASPTGINNRKFVLLGDPAMTLAFPTHKVVIDSIVTEKKDTIRALDRVSVYGHIEYQDGTRYESNATIIVELLDKPLKITTLANDPASQPYTFNFYKTHIFRGKATTNDGTFRVDFVVPKDVAGAFGYGRLLAYAYWQDNDASGLYDSIVIGGINEKAPSDNAPPEIKVFLNDESFVDGGLTHPNPLLIVHLYDDNGINISKRSIGHELVAILDGKENDAIVLNDFYSTVANDYRRGIVKYRLENLEPGPHTLTIRAWDVYNNVSEATIRFTVVDTANLELGRVVNYPNPFSQKTEFIIEHNRAGDNVKVSIDIFTISGRKVRTLTREYSVAPAVLRGLFWDGTTDDGFPVGRGVYICRVRLQSLTDNSRTEMFQKMYRF